MPLSAWTDDFSTDNFASGRYTVVNPSDSNYPDDYTIAGGQLQVGDGPPGDIFWNDPAGLVPPDWTSVMVEAALGSEPHPWNFEIGFQPASPVDGNYAQLSFVAGFQDLIFAPGYRVGVGAYFGDQAGTGSPWLPWFAAAPYVGGPTPPPPWSDFGDPAKVRLTLTRDGLLLLELGVGVNQIGPYFYSAEGFVQGQNVPADDRSTPNAAGSGSVYSMASNVSPEVAATITGLVPFGFLSGFHAEPTPQPPAPMSEWGWSVRSCSGATPGEIVAQQGQGGIVRNRATIGSGLAGVGGAFA